jgi:hypothetical protein
LKQIEGTYQSTRRADSTKLRISSLVAQGIASIDKDGALLIEDAKDLRGHPIKFKPLGNDLWQEVDGQRRVFAIRDDRGRIVRLAVDFPGVQLQRVPWYEGKKLIFSLLGGSLVILLAVMVATLCRFIRRVLLRKRPKPIAQPGTAWLPFASKLAGWLWVALFGTIGGIVAALGDNAIPPTPAWDKYFLLMNCVVFILLLLSAYAVISAIRASRGTLRWITKVKFALVAVACAFLSWFAIHWHLIGPAGRI